MIRRTKSEVELQLPAKLRSTVAVDLPPATLKTLKKLFAEAGGASESASSPSILQLRQLDTCSVESNNCVRSLCYNPSDPLLTSAYCTGCNLSDPLLTVQKEDCRG